MPSQNLKNLTNLSRISSASGADALPTEIFLATVCTLFKLQSSGRHDKTIPYHALFTTIAAVAGAQFLSVYAAECTRGFVLVPRGTYVIHAVQLRVSIFKLTESAIIFVHDILITYDSISFLLFL